MKKISIENEIENADEILIISDVHCGLSMWYDNFKIGDTIRYDLIVNYRKTGDVIDFILTEEILKNIKKYEDATNFHNMRVVN